MILLEVTGGGVDSLIELFKDNASLIIGVGFLLAGLSVLKKIVTNHERTKNAIITYIVALVVFLCIWALI
jgi:hypothetical protein